MLSGLLHAFNMTNILFLYSFIAAYIIPQTGQRHSHVEFPRRIMATRLIYFLLDQQNCSLEEQKLKVTCNI